MYALIPIQHDNHYGLLIIDLSQTANDQYQLGKNNYFIEPYAAHIPLDSIHHRLATTLDLISSKNQPFPISVINLSQTETGSPCSDYYLGVIMRILIENEIAITNLKKYTYLLNQNMIMNIRMMISVTHGFEYFKLQLSTHVKNEPETTLTKAFESINAIASRFKAPPASPTKELIKIQQPKRKITFPEIDMSKYSKYGRVTKNARTSCIKRAKTDFFQQPTESYSQSQILPSLATNTLPNPQTLNGEHASQQELEILDFPTYLNSSFE